MNNYNVANSKTRIMVDPYDACHKPYVIALEGLDNTGKTTFAHALLMAIEELKKQKGIETDKTIWVCPSFGVGSLDEMLRDCLSSNQNDYCHTSQALIALAALNNAYQQYYDADVLIFDRYYYSTSAYQDIALYQIKKIADVIHLPKPDKVILFTEQYNVKNLDRLDKEYARYNTEIRHRFVNSMISDGGWLASNANAVLENREYMCLFHTLVDLLKLDEEFKGKPLNLTDSTKNTNAWLLRDLTLERVNQVKN